jgi:serine protease Do
MSIVSRLRKRRTLSLGLLTATLATGILIGTLIDTNVQADPTQSPVTDATPLSIPSPVQITSEFARLAQDIEPAVVFITSEYAPEPRRRTGAETEEDLEFFQRFFGDEFDAEPRRRRPATGSGFLVDPKGYIITNYHVVADAAEVHVKLVDEQTEHTATLVGFDSETDLAVIKIDAAGTLPTVQIGNSDAVQVGEWAVAIGSPFGLEASVTVGIVSAKGRDIAGAEQFQRFIQTDAAINPGNSGGPLLNARGEVIGVNSMIATSSGVNQGIGFALPINMAVNVYNQITKSGRVTRGSIGVGFSQDELLLEAYGLSNGVVVNEVPENGPGRKAGLRVEDVILAIDGVDVVDGDDLVARVADTPVGTEVRLTIDRDGERLEFPLTIEDRAEVWAERFPSYSPEEPVEPPQVSESRFGIEIQNLASRQREELGAPQDAGVVVVRVLGNSFAEEIGIREEDVIVSINRQPVSSEEDVRRIHATLTSGDAVGFRVLRPVRNRGRVSLFSQYFFGVMP